jgi:hypothetical protein
LRAFFNPLLVVVALDSYFGRRAGVYFRIFRGCQNGVDNWICFFSEYAWLISPFLSIQLGTIGRAKRKVDEMQKVIAESRRAGH